MDSRREPPSWVGGAGATAKHVFSRAEQCKIASCNPEVSNLRLREIAPIPAAGDPRLVGPLVSAEDYAAKVAGLSSELHAW